MDHNIHFSFVIPSYNRASIIGATIQSLLNQTYSHFEILVIDDGSTDDTQSVIQALDDERVQYIRIKNSERGTARNTGARIAKGAYINFFDSDDIALPHHLDTAMAFISSHGDPPLFHLAYNFVDNDGNVFKEVNKFSGNINEQLLTKGNVFSCNGVFLRKDIAAAHPFIEDRNLAGSEDAVLWMQLACHFTWLCDNTITTSIVNHDSRSVVSMNKEKLLTRLSLFVQYVTEYPAFKFKYKKFAKNIRAEAYTYATLHLAMAGYTSDAISYLFKMYKNDFMSFFTRRNLACIKRILLSFFNR